MSEQSNGPTGPPPGRPPGPAAAPETPPGGSAGSGGTPPSTGPPAGAAAGGTGPGRPSEPMPQWYPATPRQPFRERTTRLWLALVVALACLIVGLGVGIAIGHAVGNDDRGPRFQRFPGDGPGYGYRDGRRFDRGDRLGIPDRRPDTSQPPQPQSSPSATR